jgi:hypothetical protein
MPDMLKKSQLNAQFMLTLLPHRGTMKAYILVMYELVIPNLCPIWGLFIKLRPAAPTLMLYAQKLTIKCSAYAQFIFVNKMLASNAGINETGQDERGDSLCVRGARTCFFPSKSVL